MSVDVVLFKTVQTSYARFFHRYRKARIDKEFIIGLIGELDEEKCAGLKLLLSHL